MVAHAGHFEGNVEFLADFEGDVAAGALLLGIVDEVGIDAVFDLVVEVGADGFGVAQVSMASCWAVGVRGMVLTWFVQAGLCENGKATH